MLEVRSFVNTPVTSNCYVLFDKEHGNDCIIVDPGSRSEKELFAFIDEKGLSPKFIILTHEHFDHCWGVNALVKLYQIPVVCSSLCAEAIKDKKRNCSVFYDNVGFTIESDEISIESISNYMPFLGNDMFFYRTPGHTEASICILIAHYLFTGDTLIKDETTVTKLPTGSALKLKESISFLSCMRGKGLIAYPGHGDTFGIDGYNFF